MSQLRNSAGRFTQLGIRTHLTPNLKEAAVADVIATENMIVHDDMLGIDRQIIAGLPVPPDLLDAYRAKVGDAAAAQTPGDAAREDAGGDLVGDALKQRAADLEIEGRSQMTADELRAAVAEAEAAAANA